MAVLKKQLIEKTVYEEGLDRIRVIYDQFDKVVVSFSGGKDSTVLLNMALEIAKERDKLPLEVVHFDEEAIHPTTVDYVKRVAKNPDIDFKWYCLQVKHRNACSRKEPWWYCWDEDKKDLWVRELPENAITEHPRFRKGMTMPDFAPYMYDDSYGKVGMCLGLRANESLNRYRCVASREKENYISQNSKVTKHYYSCSPIYDYTAKDIWVATQQHGWDYNTTYDIFARCGVALENQRVCPPYGEEPLRGLWLYAECYPNMWHKMLQRVHGVATAWRYANTDLYGSYLKEAPFGMTWKEYLPACLKVNGKKEQKQLYATINQLIKQHNRKCRDKIPENDDHPVTGVGYKLFCKMALRGDLKGRTARTLTWDLEKSKEVQQSNYLEHRKKGVQ